MHWIRLHSSYDITTPPRNISAVLLFIHRDVQQQPHGYSHLRSTYVIASLNNVSNSFNCRTNFLQCFFPHLISGESDRIASAIPRRLQKQSLVWINHKVADATSEACEWRNVTRREIKWRNIQRELTFLFDGSNVDGHEGLSSGAVDLQDVFTHLSNTKHTASSQQ